MCTPAPDQRIPLSYPRRLGLVGSLFQPRKPSSAAYWRTHVSIERRLPPPCTKSLEVCAGGFRDADGHFSRAALPRSNVQATHAATKMHAYKHGCRIQALFS